MTAEIKLDETSKRRVSITISAGESVLTWSFDAIDVSNKSWNELNTHGFGNNLSPKSLANECSESRKLRDRIATIITTLKRTVKLLEENRKYYDNNERFIDYANRIINQEIESKHSQSKVAKYKVAISKFQQFLRQAGKEDILLSNINSDVIESFNKELHHDRLKISTIAFYNRILVAIYNRSVKEGKTADNTPFANVATQHRS